MAHLRTIALAGIAITFLAIARYFVNNRKYPSTSGPVLARWTGLWYIYKVWQGHFEDWNIKQHALHGKIVRVAPNKYSIDDPAASKQIYGLASPMIKTTWYSSFSDPKQGPNDNMFSVQNKGFHAMMRRKQAQLYSMTTVKHYEPYVDECVSAFVQQFDKISKSATSIDLQAWLQSYAFDAISQMTFGNRHGFIDSGAQDLGNMMHNIWKSTTFSSIAGLTSPWGFFLLVPIYGASLSGMFNFVRTLEKIAEEKFSNQSFKQDDDDPDQPATFFEKTLRARDTAPEDFENYRIGVAAQQNMIAGSDTTSMALISILYNSIKTPGIWARLRAELLEAEANGSITQPITFEESQKLPYFQRVVKEGLRISPSVGLPLWRLVPEGGVTIAGTFFPAGAWVGINPWVANYNTSVFGDDTAAFNPDRWDPAVTPKAKLEAMESYLLTFGAGSRTCMGKHISILEMSKLIPELVRRYDFELELQGPLKTENNFFVKMLNVQTKVKMASEY